MHCIPLGGVFSLVSDFPLGFEVRAMDDDQSLLSRYTATQDAAAFEELVHRYAGMVKGVCVRLLGNSHDAEEVTQECFLELARHSADVHTSLAGWLHRTATSRSLNALRSRVRRKVREKVFGAEAEAAVPAVDITEPELHWLIQGALKELPEDLRLPMILHYVDGRSQRDVAVQLGVNQSTISRRMQEALQQLREKLTRAGYAASAPAMMVLMQEHAASAATETGLTQVAVSGAAAGKVAGSTTLVSSLKGAATALLPILGYLVLGGWVSLVIAVGLILYVARYRPIWGSEIMSCLGSADLYNQPMFCLGRWDWTTPPEGWRVEVRTSLAWSVMFLGLALAFAIGTSEPPWGTVAMGMVAAAGLFLHSVRLLFRVNSVRCHRPTHVTLIRSADRPTGPRFGGQIAGLQANDPTLTWFDAVQMIAIGLAGVGIAILIFVRPQPGLVWPAVILGGTIGLGMLYSGAWLSRRLILESMDRSIRAPRVIETETRSRGTRRVLATGVAIVVALSFWIVWNPASVRGVPLSLAALQTSILGWMVYRVAASCRTIEPRFIGRLVFVLLVGCFVLNSGVCLANLFP